MRNALSLACLCSTLLASVALAAPAGGNLTPARKAACAAICDAKDNASCKNSPKVADCVKNCTTFAGEAPAACLKQWDDWTGELAKTTWSCDDEGFVVPKYNGSEFPACVADLKPKVQTYPVCAVSAAEHYCDNCLGAMCPDEALACGQSADCKAMYACLGTCNPMGEDAAKVACIAKCSGKHKAGAALFQTLNACFEGNSPQGTGCNSQCHFAMKGFGYTDTDGSHKELSVFPACTGMAP